MDKTFCIRLDEASQIFSAAHFITFDSMQCEALHGHDFHVTAELEQTLSPAGYVVDFIPFSETLQKIVKKLDHKIILQGENPKLKFTMEEIEPEEPEDLTNWMTKMNGWLSSVNQYGDDAEKTMTPDDYFQKMAQMVGEMTDEESAEPEKEKDGLSENDFSAFFTNLQEKEAGQNSLNSNVQDQKTCGISNGMTAMKVELEVRYGSKRWIFPMEECVILPIANSTAELLAEYIAEQLAHSELLLGGKWTRLLVEVEEAPGMKGICTLRQ